VIFGQINIAHNLRRIITDFQLWMTLYIFERQLTNLAVQWGISLPLIQDWNLDVNTARTDPIYIPFITNNLNFIEDLLTGVNIIAEHANPIGTQVITAQKIIKAFKPLHALYNNACARFNNLRLNTHLLTENQVNYKNTLTYFDRMIYDQDTDILFCQGVTEFIAVITGHPVGALRNVAELRQKLQLALTDAEDAPSCLNRCITCDPPLCCGDCCLSCCNPTTKAAMARISAMGGGILGLIGAITTIQKVPEICRNLIKLIFGESSDRQPTALIVQGMGGNGVNVPVHNIISSIDMLYLFIFVFSVLLFIYGTLGLIKDCFGGNNDDRSHDREPDEKRPLLDEESRNYGT